MAYQPKSYRKFVATAATATLVASAVTPAFAAETGAAASFTDVPERYQEAVTYLVDNKITLGLTPETFGTLQSIKRVDAAVMIAKALQLELEVADRPDSGFEDVPDRAKAYVDALKAEGYINGKTATSFGSEQVITRGEIALILANAYNLKGTSDKEFSDVSSRYEAAVKALVAADITQGKTATTFGTADAITRGEFAIFLYKAEQIVEGPAVANVSAVNVAGQEAVTISGKVANASTASIVVLNSNDQEVYDQNVTVNADGTFSRTIELPAGNYVYEVRAIEGDKESAVKAGNFAVAAVNAEVASVNAINAKQVQVKFNTAVDKDTVFSNVSAGTIASGAVTVSRTTTSTTANENVTSVTGQLSEDGKTLTLTAAGSTYFNGTYAVTVSDSVKTTNNKAIKPFASTVVAADTSAPSVTGATYDVQSNKIVVTLSEPAVAKPDVVRLNGTPVAAADVSFVSGSNNTKVEFVKPPSVASGSTATIYVAGAADAKGNVLTPYNGNVTITADASELSIASISQVSSNVAKVVFNKTLASDNTAIDGAINVIRDGAVVDGTQVTAALDTTDTTNKTVLVTFTTGTAPNYFYGDAASKAQTFVFANNVITDVFGKKLGSTTQSLTFNKDAAGPQVVSSKLGTTDGTIEVTFNEDIATTGTPANIVLRKDGVALNTAASAARKVGDTKTLVITAATADLVSGKLPAGTYTVRLEAGAIADAHTNNNTVQTVSVSQSGTTTDLTAAFANTSSVNNQFEVTFDADVTTASALNLANYTLDGAALPAGTDIYFKNGAANRTVVIVLPANSINIGNTTTPANARLAVAGVQTSAGKAVVPNSGTVRVVDNTASTLQSASLVGNNIVKLSFNENVTASFDNIADILDDVVIANGTDTFVAGNATATASVSGKDLIITVTPGTSNWTTVTSASTVTVKTVDTGDGDVKDVNGVEVKPNVSVTLTK